MRRYYELAFVFRVMNTDEEQREVISQVIEWIEEDDNGKVISIDRNRLGRRKLAYPISKQREGLYYIIYADIEPSHMPEMELNLKLYPNVLRYLVIRLDELPEGLILIEEDEYLNEEDNDEAEGVEETDSEESSETLEATDEGESSDEAESEETSEPIASDDDAIESEENESEVDTNGENELDAAHLRGAGPVAIQNFNEQGWYTYQDLVDAGKEAINEISGISDTAAEQIYEDALAIVNEESE